MNTHSWKKLGRIFNAEFDSCHPKMVSHAANPLPLFIEEDIYRIFFSCRDARNRSSVGVIDYDLLRHEMVNLQQTPVFEHGPTGSFYADGISLGNTFRVNGTTYMLYMGWQNFPGSHWRGDIGRLIVKSDLNLELASTTPYLAGDKSDPISLSYPWVMANTEGGFDIWYGSTMTWDAGNGEMLHVIKHASSADGVTWDRRGLAVPYEIDIAQAFSRPTVIGDPNTGYHMWFSYRGANRSKYRIGYAFSEDRLLWQTAVKNSGIDVSKCGWDSDMIEYPYVFEHKGEKYMLYNGNGYGKSGFGIAILDNG